MGMVMTITRQWTVFSKLKHYLFDCPTFWRRKPAFQCPHCGKEYRCYWDGNDCGGKINVCHACAADYERLGAWNETSNGDVRGASVTAQPACEASASTVVLGGDNGGDK